MFNTNHTPGTSLLPSTPLSPKPLKRNCFIPIVLCIPALLFPAPACLLAFLRRNLVANGMRLFFIDTIFAFPCVLFLHLVLNSITFHILYVVSYLLQSRKKTQKKSELDLYLYVFGIYRSLCIQTVLLAAQSALH
ncbi:hypothetical protein EYC80_004798 [Monilinia laxa]|uniref:Uncharacterized protein n=1 Tax=Monilinia laxa TaxID=61186 RepID=A0A5N6KI52_MONLA|nr:hypothetical protein EYC80_004798 [Monilinia laxa]